VFNRLIDHSWKKLTGEGWRHKFDRWLRVAADLIHQKSILRDVISVAAVFNEIAIKSLKMVFAYKRSSLRTTRKKKFNALEEILPI
jgi:hypothetical protein